MGETSETRETGEDFDFVETECAEFIPVELPRWHSWAAVSQTTGPRKAQ